MRLLVVSTWFPWPPDNGARLRAWHLVRELSRRHRITLLSFSEGGAIEPERVAPLRECCESVEVLPRDPFHRGRLSRRGLFSATPRAYLAAYSPDMRVAAARALPGHDAALALGITAAFHLDGISDVPVVFEEAELTVIRDQYLREPSAARRLRRGLTWWKYARFVRRLCRQAAFTTVVSEAERAILGSIGCDVGSVAVVPNGVDPGDLEWPRPSQPARRCIYPGSLSYSANLDAVTWFLEAILPIVRRDQPDADFWVTGAVGDARLPDVFASMRPTLTGNLPDVRPAIAGSALCVVPLRIGGGTRLKILQAMALGTPVVATSKGAEGLDVTPGRDILIGDTPDEFAAQVIRLLNDTALADTVSTAARALVRSRYTWTRCGAILDEVVRRAAVREDATRR